MPLIIRACAYVNSIKTDHELECLTTILFLVEEYVLSEEVIQALSSYKGFFFFFEGYATCPMTMNNIPNRLAKGNRRTCCNILINPVELVSLVGRSF
jgi:hypothetical protein